MAYTIGLKITTDRKLTLSDVRIIMGLIRLMADIFKLKRLDVFPISPKALKEMDTD